MSLAFLFILQETFGSNDFNFDINERVQDNIRSFLQKISAAGRHPVLQFQTGLFPISEFNASSSGWMAISTLFVNIKRIFIDDLTITAVGKFRRLLCFGFIEQINFVIFLSENFSSGFHNKLFAAIFNQDYNNLYSNLTYNMYLVKSMPTNMIVSENRAIDVMGRATNRLLGYTNIDCTIRPWYLAAQSHMAPCWSAPYLSLNNLPVISYCAPIIDVPYAGKTTGLTGVVTYIVQLSQLNNFLRNAYQNSTNYVFIVEKSTGNLIASSLNAKTYSVSSSGAHVRCCLS